MAKQVCVFAENKPGRLERITDILMEARINIRAVTIATSQGFGIVKLLVDEPDRALDLLRREGLSAYARQVIAVVMGDQPGGLHRIARACSSRGINIEDAYGFIIRDKEKAVMVLDVEDIPDALNMLQDAGLVMLSDEELYSL